MVKVITKYKKASYNGTFSGKTRTENFKTVKDARRFVRFIGSAGSSKIISRGKSVKRRSSSNYNGI